PDIAKTRWRKKSDFYSLFLVFAAHGKSLPLSSNQRQSAARRLHEFGEQVTMYLREFANRANTGDFDDAEIEEISNIDQPQGTSTPSPGDVQPSDEVVQYAAAVQRAASDLGNRRRRAQQLEKLLESAWR